VETAINLFCGLWLGVDLPRAAQDQTVWDVAPPGIHDVSYERGSWGGHAVAVLAYQRTGLTCVTWGALKTMTWDWVHAYCSEAWATIDRLWIADDGLAPNGFNAQLLAQDLAAIGAA